MIRRQTKMEFLSILSKESYTAINTKRMQLTVGRQYWMIKTKLGWIYGLNNKEQAKKFLDL